MHGDDHPRNQSHTKSTRGRRMDWHVLFGGNIFSVVVFPPPSLRASGASLVGQPCLTKLLVIVLGEKRAPKTGV